MTELCLLIQEETAGDGVCHFRQKGATGCMKDKSHLLFQDLQYQKSISIDRQTLREEFPLNFMYFQDLHTCVSVRAWIAGPVACE